MKTFKKIFTLTLVLALIAFSSSKLIFAKQDDDHEDSHKINICHKDGDSGNWNALRVDENGWGGYSGHSSDYLYNGPTDDGKPDKKDHKDDNWCKDHAPVVDVCPNIEGDQATVPDGKHKDEAGNCVEDTPQTATISAKKVICDSEADLPNWGAGGPDITSTTAQDWVNSHEGCHLSSWTFQWAPNDAANPGDNIESASAPWATFTDTAVIPGGYSVWVREELPSNYLPFSGASSDFDNPVSKNSAEFYCNNDVLNYDNYDFVSPVEAGQTYNCVGFNVLKTPPTATINATKVVCDSEADLPNWGAGDHGPITSSTAQDWVDQSDGACHIVSPWNFQWSPSAENSPNDNTQTAPEPWTSFTGTTQVPSGAPLFFREEIPSDYVPFSGANSDYDNPQSKYSAEFYCADDAKNYDNLELIYTLDPGQTYNCVGFNTLKEEVNQCVDELDGSWADTVVSSNQGKRKDGSAVIAARSDKNLALGPSDWTTGGSTGFYSLGFGGTITLSFDSFVPDVAGPDIFIHEATNGTYPLEKATVEVSQNGTDWELAGTADNTPANKISEIDFSGTSFSWIKFVRITDTSNKAIFPNDADGFDLDSVKVAQQVCSQPQDEEQFATVTMCKTDDTESHNPLSGWTLMLKGVSVQTGLSVPTNISTGINSDPLVAGTSYIAKAVGTWLNQGGANPVDAEYSTTDGWTTHMDGYTGYSTDILELQIDNKFDPNSNWGAYNSSHTYAQSFIPTISSSNFRIFDGTGTTQNEGWFGDNSGTLSVDINKGFAGITGENGCVTFQNVPYGNYSADEIMQDGWNNVSGLMDVVVSHQTETFNVVNHYNKDGFIHVFKFVDGEQATSDNTDGAVFPMYNNRDINTFTLGPVGWWSGNN